MPPFWLLIAMIFIGCIGTVASYPHKLYDSVTKHSITDQYMGDNPTVFERVKARFLSFENTVNSYLFGRDAGLTVNIALQDAIGKEILQFGADRMVTLNTGHLYDIVDETDVSVELNKVIGLAIANGIVALSGALLAQYKGSANINDGRGAIVIGLAAIFIGLSVSQKIKSNFVVSMIGCACGGVMYYIVYNVVILMGLKTDFLKMLSAIIVAIFLSVPYVKATYFTKRRNAGGGRHA